MAADRRRSAIAFWALAGVALLAAHDAIFLVQVGPGREVASALRTAEHGWWGVASAALVGVGVAAAVATLVRIRRLATLARGLPDARPGGIRARVGPAWMRIFAIVLVGFALQENAEHFIRHGHLIGLGALLGPEYPLAIPVIAAVTLVAAAVASAVAGTERSLMDRIASALTVLARPACRLGRPPVRLNVARPPILATAGASRAPPPLVPTTSV